jgi:hypothetical protein
MDKLQQ